MSIKFSVVTAVGPQPHNKRWLDECMESVEKQTYQAHEHVIVTEQPLVVPPTETLQRRVVTLSWLYGISALNVGIHFSECDWIVNLDSDDYLFPNALEMMNTRILEIGLPEFYLRFVVIENNGTLIAGGRCVHKNLWKAVGGYINSATLDQDFHTKITNAGYQTQDLYPDPIYFHRQHDDNYSRWGPSKWK